MNQTTPAERLLKSLGVRCPDEINLEAIAYCVGATVKYRALSGCEARIVGAGEKAVISVNSRSIPTRQRFSLGHELGHWHHHRGRTFICRKDDIGNRARRRRNSDPERVADIYASDLVLPRYLFEPMALDEKRCSFKAIDVLREEFKTSITATAIRMVDFGPEPAMLVCHTSKGRKWFYSPKRIPERWFPRDELDPDSYAMDVVYGREKQGRKALMPADSWFDRREAKKYDIYEETKQTMAGEALTLLVFKDEAMLEDEE